MVTEADYQRATNGAADERQRFLEELGFGNFEPYVKRITYRTSQPSSLPTAAAKALTPIFSSLGYHLRSRVHVYPAFFDRHNVNEARNVLLHEGKHAKDMYEKPGVYVLPLLMRARFKLHVAGIVDVVHVEKVRALSEYSALSVEWSEVLKNPSAFSPAYAEIVKKK